MIKNYPKAKIAKVGNFDCRNNTLSENETNSDRIVPFFGQIKRERGGEKGERVSPLFLFLLTVLKLIRRLSVKQKRFSLSFFFFYSLFFLLVVVV